MAKTGFTMQFVEGLTATGKVQLIRVPDNLGLYLHVAAKPGWSGNVRKTWVFRYSKKFVRRPSKLTLGEYPAMSISKAIALAADLREGLRTGKDPKKMRSPESVPKPLPEVDTTPTLREVAEMFYAGHVLVKNQPSTQTYQRWALDKYVIPILGKKKITEITPQTISRFLDGLASTPVTANRVKALVSKMFNWARRRVDSLSGVANPATGYERHAETPRERRLSEAEVIRLGEEYRKSPDPLRAVALFLLLTGSREGVAFNLRPENKFPDEGLLRFEPRTPGLKGCRKVYFSRTAASLLEKFPTVVVKRSLWRSWSEFRDDAGLGPKPLKKGAVPRTEDKGVSLHDLRRSWSSIGVDLGHDGGVVDAVQGHSIGKIRGTYQQRSDPVLAKVAEEIGEHIAMLLGIAVPIPKPTRTKAGRVKSVEEHSTGSGADHSSSAEPPVGAKAARMPKKDTQAATPTGKAKLFRRPQR